MRHDSAVKRSATALQFPSSTPRMVHHLMGECITMATTKPRITVTLDEGVYETLKGLSDLQGVSMSSIVSELLRTVDPVQRKEAVRTREPGKRKCSHYFLILFGQNLPGAIENHGRI